MVSQAVTTIKDGAKYRITCQRYDNGCVVLGEKHDAAAFLYYATNLETVPEDAWWVLSVKGAGFTMKNAATGQYMVYKSGKLTNDAGQYTAKGIQLSNTADDNYAVWTLTETTTGMLIIENAGAPGNISTSARMVLTCSARILRQAPTMGSSNSMTNRATRWSTRGERRETKTR